MSDGIPTLDARTMPLAQRHAAIFSAFDRLATGEAFVLINDHDPKPLLHQLQARCAGAFEWNVLEAGPECFRIEIRRRTSGTSPTVTEYLEEDHRRLDALLLEAGHLTDAAAWAQAQGRFREFACGLTRHIDVEEGVLFPAFEAMAGSANGPTVVMRAEHEEIRRRLDEAAAILEERDATAAKHAIDALTGALSVHNMKEEAILYPMTDRWLREARARDELVNRMQAF